MASNEAKVVSINKLKSNSFRLALAVRRSRNESNGESFSLVEYAGMPDDDAMVDERIRNE